MADPFGVVTPTDLTTFRDSVLSSDPYGIAGNVISSWQPNYSTLGPAEAGLTSFGRAFMAGLLGNYAKQNAAEQTNQLIGILPQLQANPLAIAAPEGIDTDAFANLKASAIIKKMQLDAAKEQSLAERLAKITDAGLTKKAEIMGENQAYGIGASENPNSPTYKAAQDKISLASSLRKELLGNKEIVEFGDVNNRIKVLQKASLDPTAMADLDYYYAVAKILDPGSVVRESEAGMVIDSSSIPSATLGYLNKMMAGGAAMQPEARQAAFNLAKRHYDTRSERVGAVLDRYRTLAEKSGLDPVDILPYAKQDLTLQGLAQKPAQGTSVTAIDAALARRGLDPQGRPLSGSR